MVPALAPVLVLDPVLAPGAAAALVLAPGAALPRLASLVSRLATDPVLVCSRVLLGVPARLSADVVRLTFIPLETMPYVLDDINMMT